jgi:hypothetical protein
MNIASGNDIKYIIKEVVYQSADHLQQHATAVALVQSWIPKTGVLTVTNIAGEFTDGQAVIGATSGAEYTLTIFDPLEAPARKEVYDNQYINVQGTNITNTSEINPFGSI